MTAQIIEALEDLMKSIRELEAVRNEFTIHPPAATVYDLSNYLRNIHLLCDCILQKATEIERLNGK